MQASDGSHTIDRLNGQWIAISMGMILVIRGDEANTAFKLVWRQEIVQHLHGLRLREALVG